MDPTENGAAIYDEMRELYIHLCAVEESYRKYKIVYYRPIGQQPDFHMDSRASIRLVMGSNRSGKTVCGAAEAIAHSMGERPWLPKDHPDRIVLMPDGSPIPVPNVGRVIAENFNVAITQTIKAKFEEWAPADQIKKWKFSNRQILERIEWKNGSITHFMAYQQDDEAFEGTSGHWAWFDEPPPRAIFTAIRRGLIDFGGHCWITMTPISQAWISEDIILKAPDEPDRIKTYMLNIWDNCTENGGYLTRSAIEDFIASLSEDEKSARIDAIYFNLVGKVFKDWQPRPPYYIKPFPIPDSWPKVCVIDPHSRKPVCVVWIAFAPTGARYVYRDLFDPGLRTITDVANRMKELEGWDDSDQYETINMRIIDTSANQFERTAGETVTDRFVAEGINCVNAYKKDYWSGIDAIKEDLKIQRDWDKPNLMVFNNCRKVKNDFMLFCYAEWQTSKAKDEKGQRQEVRKIHDDALDGIKYTYQLRLTYDNLFSPMINHDVDDSANYRIRTSLFGSAGMRREERAKWRTSRRRN